MYSELEKVFFCTIGFELLYNSSNIEQVNLRSIYYIFNKYTLKHSLELHYYLQRTCCEIWICFVTLYRTVSWNRIHRNEIFIVLILSNWYITSNVRVKGDINWYIISESRTKQILCYTKKKEDHNHKNM